METLDYTIENRLKMADRRLAKIEEKAVAAEEKAEIAQKEAMAAKQINRLYTQLAKEKRFDDLARATEDEAFCAQLLKELES